MSFDTFDPASNRIGQGFDIHSRAFNNIVSSVVRTCQSRSYLLVSSDHCLPVRLRLRRQTSCLATGARRVNSLPEFVDLVGDVGVVGSICHCLFPIAINRRFARDYNASSAERFRPVVAAARVFRRVRPFPGLATWRRCPPKRADGVVNSGVRSVLDKFQLDERTRPSSRSLVN
jgi:hypothetical protein